MREAKNGRGMEEKLEAGGEDGMRSRQQIPPGRVGEAEAEELELMANDGSCRRYALV